MGLYEGKTVRRARRVRCFPVQGQLPELTDEKPERTVWETVLTLRVFELYKLMTQ